MNDNPFKNRLLELIRLARRRRLDAVVLFGQKNVLSLTGVDCDNGCAVMTADGWRLRYATDFRYVPAVRRLAPWLDVLDCRRDLDGAAAGFLRDMRPCRRIGFEGSLPTERYLRLVKAFPRVKFVDIGSDMLDLRAVKTPEEIARIAAAEALNDRIWTLSKKEFRPGMTEKDMQRVIRAYMNALGDGEAFETIVCVGANAAECHHVPDDTVWRKGEPLLVDMGVKLDGVCSDMTRCIPAKGGDRAAVDEYARIYDIVLSANMAAIAAAKPGMTGRQLDAVARRIIRKAGYGKAFGHALGHGVGYDIHEHPVASGKSGGVLKPGMLVTIEPGIYLPGKLGVRIEDLVAITDGGCEVLSRSRK